MSEIRMLGGLSLKKTKKLLTGIVSATMVTSLAACGEEEELSLPPVPDDNSCAEWEWDYDDEVWECDDIDSPHFGYYYFAGRAFKSKSDLYKSSAYKSYRSGSTYEESSSSTSSSGSTYKGNSSSTSSSSKSSSPSSSTSKSSGFGSGSKGGFGG